MPLHFEADIRGCSAIVSAAPWYADSSHTAFSTPGMPDGVRQVFTRTLDIGDQVVLLSNEPNELGNVLVWRYTAAGDVRQVHKDALSLLPMGIVEEVDKKSFLTREVCAHVLNHFTGQGYRAGSFISALIDLLTKADPENFGRLALVYPGYAEAVRLAQQNHQGVDLLTALMRDEKKMIALLWPLVYE